MGASNSRRNVMLLHPALESILHNKGVHMPLGASLTAVSDVCGSRDSTDT